MPSDPAHPSLDPSPAAGMWTPPPPGPVSFGGPAFSVVPVASRRRRWRPVLLGVPALVLVAAASSIVTAVVVGHDSTSGNGTPAAAADHGHAHASAAAHHATVGTIDSLHGSSWTLTTQGGKSVSVELGTTTAYGSKAKPSTASAFHPGAQVKVTGTKDGSTITATRVVLVPAPSSSGSSSSSSSGTPS